MKRLIRKILKEELEVVDKKFCDKVVNRLLSDVYLENNKNRQMSFGSVGELMDMGILESEMDEVIHNDKVFQKLGWWYSVDEEDPYDEGEYYRIDKPNDFYSYDEFQLEVLYDWLHSLVDQDIIGYDENSGEYGEWILPQKDLNMKIKHIPYFLCPIRYNFVSDSYSHLCKSNSSDRLKIMDSLNKSYGIGDTDMYEYILDSFYSKLPERLSELGLDNYDESPTIKKLNESVIDDFIEFGRKELSLGDDFRVNLTSNGDDIETLASYDMIDGEINVLTKGRAIPDIIRSIAHEMVHHKQNSRGDLRGNPEEGEDGSPWEDEANSKAGVLVRKFGKINPEIYDL